MAVTKLKLSDLAKELGILPHQLLRVLQQVGVEVKTDDPELTEDVIEAARELVQDESFDNDRVYVKPNQTVRSLAKVFDSKAEDLQKRLMEDGLLVGLTQRLKPEVVEQLADELGYILEWDEGTTPVAPPKPAAHKPNKSKTGVQPRPPIVTILGHVDHGKTTLLDHIRHSAVAAGEAGGITQHIGAYQVEVAGRKITFLDTPGHEAFTAMRARGAQVTDIAILVVAAEDGIMPQTREAIDHAKSAGVPIIVAINKCDKPDANPERVKQQLTEHGLVPEDWGGDTIVCNISALTGEGVPHLLEMILLVADVAEIAADPKAPLDAVVIEARLDKGRGPLATVLVHEGTLRRGDAIQVSRAYGSVRAMNDFEGKPVAEAGPGMPVEVLGLSEPPEAGDKVVACKNEREARAKAEAVKTALREQSMAPTPHHRASLQDLLRSMAESETKELNIILRADVKGSVEAIAEQLNKLQFEDVRVKVISQGVGSITENDILLARAASAVCVAFNTGIEPGAKRAAKDQNIDVRYYNIIYELLEDMELAAKGLLAPKFEETLHGVAEIRRVFKLSKGYTVAGCYVTEGKILRSARARVRRPGVEEPLFDGAIASLKHIKDDVREMAAGFECGIQLEGFTGYAEGDLIECYSLEQVGL
ncbi:MAG: translation initiation factor IF-2 [Fimbriimonadia bacterium]